MKYLTGLLLSIVVASVALAQSGVRNYNPATETTITGTVDSVTQVPSQGRGGPGVHIALTAPSGAIDVHAGPASFIASKNVTFAKGDTLTVVGSKMMLSEKEAIIAREIKRGDLVLTLRDASGIPLWSRSSNR